MTIHFNGEQNFSSVNETQLFVLFNITSFDNRDFFLYGNDLTHLNQVWLFAKIEKH